MRIKSPCLSSIYGYHAREGILSWGRESWHCTRPVRCEGEAGRGRGIAEQQGAEQRSGRVRCPGLTELRSGRVRVRVGTRITEDGPASGLRDGERKEEGWVGVEEEK
jgi:hypothetical protein